MKLQLIALSAALASNAAFAGPEKIKFPSDYLKGVLYQTLDRPDSKQYRELYAPAEVVEAVRKGQPIPHGAVDVPILGDISARHARICRDGEGYVLEVLADMRALVYWFSFDGAGARRWFFGTGRIDGDRLVFDELFTTAGGVFGPGFDPDAVTVAPWGSLELDLTCAAGTARFAPTEAGFPAGTLGLVRLSRLGGLDCAD